MVRFYGRGVLPAGLGVRTLEPHPDERGVVVEVFRAEWRIGVEPVQWNAVASSAGVLRGVHLHLVHADHLTVVAGRMLLGLHDLRPDSETRGLGTIIELSAERPSSVVIPVGVAHGFYFPEP
jgi:dTDP-4-dehydrorhamnose 3,5-epimerase